MAPNRRAKPQLWKRPGYLLSEWCIPWFQHLNPVFEWASEPLVCYFSRCVTDQVAWNIIGVGCLTQIYQLWLIFVAYIIIVLLLLNFTAAMNVSLQNIGWQNISWQNISGQNISLTLLLPPILALAQLYGGNECLPGGVAQGVLVTHVKEEPLFHYLTNLLPSTSIIAIRNLSELSGYSGNWCPFILVSAQMGLFRKVFTRAKNKQNTSSHLTHNSTQLYSHIPRGYCSYQAIENIPLIYVWGHCRPLLSAKREGWRLRIFCATKPPFIGSLTSTAGP